MNTQHNKVPQHTEGQGRSVLDGQRWKSSQQREEGAQKNLSREQLEAGKATSGSPTVRTAHLDQGGYPSANLDTQPVRIGEDEFQHKHGVNLYNQIQYADMNSVSEEIRAQHGLSEKDGCEGCGKQDCLGCGNITSLKKEQKKTHCSQSNCNCSAANCHNSTCDCAAKH